MAKATLFQDDSYNGQKLTVERDNPDFTTEDFNDKLSSVIVESGSFTLYQDISYKGYSVTIDQHGGPGHDGHYPDSTYLGNHNDSFSSIKEN
jgi:hypothetical protein